MKRVFGHAFLLLAVLSTGCASHGTGLRFPGRGEPSDLMPEQLMGLERPNGMVHDPVTGHWAQAEVLNAYWKLRRAAEHEGWHLTIISGYRSFNGQAVIWNKKFRSLGAKKNSDPRVRVAGEVFGPFLPGPLPWATQPPGEGEGGCDDVPVQTLKQGAPSKDPGMAWKVNRVMRFISVPGFSRHHWGTDLDLGEETIRTRVQMPSGPEAERMKAFYNWLDQNAPRYGFCRVYQGEGGAIHDEPWHWSYLRLAKVCERHFRGLNDFSPLKGRGVEGWPYLSKRLPEIMSLMVDSVRTECSSLDQPPLNKEYGESDH